MFTKEGDIKHIKMFKAYMNKVILVTTYML